MPGLTISTSRYEFAHGRKPRGYEYRQWAFFFDSETDVDKAQWFLGKYSAAKIMAITYAVTKKHTRIELGS